MPLIRKSIPSLVNGVSQQASSMRLPTQGEESVNTYPSIVDGLRKRPPLKHIAKLQSGTLGDAFLHTINRDSNEQYIAIITQNDIDVYDINGVAKTVNTPDGTGYLNESTPSSLFRATTIADYTIIANQNKTVEMDPSTTPTNSSSGIVFVKQASSTGEYKVIVDGTEQANYGTTSGEDSVSTSEIATELASELTTNLGAGWTIDRIHSTIKITKDDDSAFTLDVEDSASGTYLKMAKEKVTSLSDLPIQCFNDYIVKIVGDADSEYDDYYVKFETDDSGLTEGTGSWVETVGPGIEYQFNASTMPHTLVREADGTFTFGEATWGDRVAGDTETAENPSFVGNEIFDITLFKNRLGFLSRDKLILSRSGKFFEYFPETVTTALDGNPIDVSAQHTKVSFLKNAIPFDEQLILLSAETLFVIPETDILTAKTISIDPKKEYSNRVECQPVGIGSSVFFAQDTTNYSQVFEYTVTDNDNDNDAIEITDHIPRYIPKELKKLVKIGKEHLFAITDQEPNKIYFYKFYKDLQKRKLQSAWQTWEFDSDCNILNIDSIGDELFVVSQYTDGVYLEKINVSFEADSNQSYITHLDRRVTDSDCTVTYDSGTNKTTFTLPYQVTGTMEVVTRNGGSVPTGVILNVFSQSGNDVVVNGDYSSQPVYLGVVYESDHEFSHFYLTQQRADRSEQLVSDGRLQISYISIRYEDTGYFRFEITPDLRETSIKEFTGKLVNSGQNLIDTLPLESGTLKSFVLSKNDQVSIRLKNDTFLPSNFINAEWVGFINPIARGV